MRAERFMPIAEAFAAMSKYDGTKVGAVVLGKHDEVLATGWNGAPRGSNADTPGDPRLGDRRTRLAWACHAEANAVANAARTGASLAGSTLVVTHVPCASCAKLIVQAGITKVVAPMPESEFLSRWADDLIVAGEMFRECGVTLELI